MVGELREAVRGMFLNVKCLMLNVWRIKLLPLFVIKVELREAVRG